MVFLLTVPIVQAVGVWFSSALLSRPPIAVAVKVPVQLALVIPGITFFCHTSFCSTDLGAFLACCLQSSSCWPGMPRLWLVSGWVPATVFPSGSSLVDLSHLDNVFGQIVA